MATEQVFNNRNARMGQFCRACAKKKVEALNKLEAREYQLPPRKPPPEGFGRDS